MEIISIPAQAALKYGQLWDGLSAKIKTAAPFHKQWGHRPENNSLPVAQPVWDFSQATILPALIDTIFTGFSRKRDFLFFGAGTKLSYCRCRHCP